MQKKNTYLVHLLNKTTVASTELKFPSPQGHNHIQLCESCLLCIGCSRAETTFQKRGGGGGNSSYEGHSSESQIYIYLFACMCTFFIFKRGTFYHFPKRGACAPVPHPSNYTPGVQYTTEWLTQLINGQSEWCYCFHLHQSKCHHQLIEIWGYSSICLGFICNSCFKGAWLSDFLWKVCQRINSFVGSYHILWNVQAEILLAEKIWCAACGQYLFLVEIISGTAASQNDIQLPLSFQSKVSSCGPWAFCRL